MYYPDELVEEIREKNDIVSVVGEYVKLTRKGGSYFGLCPFHNEKTGSFSVSPQKQMYYCFGCHKGGNVFSFLMDYENYTFPEAVKVLGERVGVDLPEIEYSDAEKQKKDEKTRMLEMYKQAATFYFKMLRSRQGQTGYQYLQKRGLSDETIKRFGLGYSTKFGKDLYNYLKQQGFSDQMMIEGGLVSYSEKAGSYDRFWNRVMFPIMDANHKVIGFGGRVMGEGEPKYLNSPETKIFDKSRNLYGLNYARASRKDHMIICEGYMDVIALHQAGFSQAVASLGTALTENQCRLLARYTKKVLLTYDSDAAGTNAALRAIPMLKEAGLSVSVINMKPYKDPDEFIKALGPEAFEERINQAVNSFLFEIEVIERSYDFKNPESKTAFFKATAKKLLEFTEEIERNAYVEAVAERYHLPYEKLKKMVDTMGEAASFQPVREKPRSGVKKPPKEDGITKAQKLLITWMISDDTLYDEISKHVELRDFTNELYRTVVEMLHQQKAQGKIKPAEIMSHFADSENQGEVASLFHTELKQIEKKEELEKAVTETVIKVKEHSYNVQIDEMDKNDLMSWQKILQEKSKLQRLHISL